MAAEQSWHDEIAWVPIWTPPAWRDDEQDLIPTETERTAS